MRICILQTGEPLHIDNGNYRPMRCMLLADKLIENGHDVYIISSAFFHQRKIHRSNSNKWIKIKNNLKIYLIPSLGYKNHISFKRILDHIILALNLFIFLKSNKSFIPERVFIGYPPILTSFVMTKWCLKKNIPFIVDVKDKWPEHFIEPIPIHLKKIARIFLHPYFIIARYIFKKATKITSITNEYLDWIKAFSNDDFTIGDRYFLSPLIRKSFTLSEKERYQNLNFWKQKKFNISKEKYFCFIGSYTKSFDFNFIYKSANLLLKKYPEISFVLCGSGDQYQNIIKRFQNIPNVLVFGEINKFQAKILIKHSIATLAPYVNNKNFQNHIPNKIIESLENGKPFITTLDGKLKEIIQKYNNGIFIKNDDNLNIYGYEKILKDKECLHNLNINAKKSYEELFNFEETFNKLENNLINLK